jgi:hypothetical protein
MPAEAALSSMPFDRPDGAAHLGALGCSFLAWLLLPVRSRLSPQLEILALRHQLAVYQRLGPSRVSSPQTASSGLGSRECGLAGTRRMRDTDFSDEQQLAAFHQLKRTYDAAGAGVNRWQDMHLGEHAVADSRAHGFFGRSP